MTPLSRLAAYAARGDTHVGAVAALVLGLLGVEALPAADVGELVLDGVRGAAAAFGRVPPMEDVNAAHLLRRRNVRQHCGVKCTRCDRSFSKLSAVFCCTPITSMKTLLGYGPRTYPPLG